MLVLKKYTPVNPQLPLRQQILEQSELVVASLKRNKEPQHCPWAEIQPKCQPGQYCNTRFTIIGDGVKITIKSVDILVTGWACGRSLCLAFLQMMLTGHKFEMLWSCFSTANHLVVCWKVKKSQLENIARHFLQLFTGVQRKILVGKYAL